MLVSFNSRLRASYLWSGELAYKHEEYGQNWLADAHTPRDDYSVGFFSFSSARRPCRKDKLGSVAIRAGELVPLSACPAFDSCYSPSRLCRPLGGFPFNQSTEEEAL